VKGKPGTNTTISCASLTIDKEKVMQITGLPYSDLEVPVAIRDCIVGEILTDNM
jgi:hypothetical protein